MSDLEAEGTPIEEPEAVENDDASGANYHDRIRAEADFAVEEVQKKDRHITELYEKYNKLKDLDKYVEAVGGTDRLVELAGLGNQVETDPVLREALNNARNGVTAPPPAPEPEEEIFDPEVKAVHAKFSDIIAQQGKVIEDLQSRLNETEAVSLKSSLSTNIEAALSMFADDKEALSAAQAEISRAVAQTEKAAASGDRSAALQLKQIAAPGGARTLEMMTLDIYKDYVARKLESANATPKPDGETMLRATDPKNTNRSSPTAPVVAVRTGGPVTSQTVDALMADITRKLGKDPDKLWS